MRKSICSSVPLEPCAQVDAGLKEHLIHEPVSMNDPGGSLNMNMPSYQYGNPPHSYIWKAGPWSWWSTVLPLGRRWHTSFRVSHLVPMELCVTFPHSYPSDASPHFTLSCLWLEAPELSAICGQLDELWQDQPGVPIVFTWVDWLQNNTLWWEG